MATIIRAPSNAPIVGLSLFLAGGISNCPNWQRDAIDLFSLVTLNGIIINPRRDSIENSEKVAAEQITWEYNRLHAASAVFFWFPKETLCPITLFELGTMCHSTKPIFVGTHPEYQRRFDVIKQLELYRPTVTVYDRLDETVNAVLKSRMFV